MLAVYADPLRESAQRALIAVHLAEGNVVEAHRVFTRYRRLILDELGVEPAIALQAPVDGMGTACSCCTTSPTTPPWESAAWCGPPT